MESLVSLCPNKPFQTLNFKFTICAEVRFRPARSKIPTLVPMGRRSGSLFNHTYSSQFSICDRTRFRPAVASSLTFSLWVDVRNSLLKRPNQHSFAICNKERFTSACSNIKKKKHYKLRPVRLRLGEFRICLFQYPSPLYNDGSTGSSLLVYTKFCISDIGLLR